MLNNEFRLIGTIVSDWKRIGSDDFPKHKVSIEVEKRTKGKTCTFELVAFEKNYVIDVTKSLKGKQVIVTGYLDLNKNYVNLVVQDFVVIGGVEEKEDSEKPLYDEEGEPIEEKIEVDLPDDDLPF